VFRGGFGKLLSTEHTVNACRPIRRPIYIAAPMAVQFHWQRCPLAVQSWQSVPAVLSRQCCRCSAVRAGSMARILPVAPIPYCLERDGRAKNATGAKMAVVKYSKRPGRARKRQPAKTFNGKPT